MGTGRRVLMLTQDVDIDRRILLEADALRVDGWKVTILAMPDPSLDPQREPPGVVRATRRSGGAAKERAVMAIYRACRRRLAMNGRLMRPLKAFAWRFLVDQESFHSRLFLGSALEHPCDVVVAHDLPMLSVASAVAEASGALLVYDSHELFTEKEMSPRERRRWTAIERRHIGACRAVITVNPSIARELEARYQLPSVNAIYNAENPLPEGVAPRSLRARCSLADEEMVLLYQGSMNSGRNLEALVDAMHLVKDKSVHLVMMGRGPLPKRLLAVADQSGSRVHFTPAVAQSELLEWTASADVGIIPYRANCLNNRLCTPNKLFEFIAAGIPVLANDLPELRAIVVGNGVGTVAPMDTPEQIARAIDHMFADATRLNEIRQRCRVARHELGWEHQARRVRSIFASLLDSKA